MLITNFASGELSKKLSGRVDLQPYYSGASLIKNFEIIPTGGIERRTGTQRLQNLEYTKDTQTLPGASRLIPFILDKDTSFILQIAPGITTIWENGAKYSRQPTISNPYENMDQIDAIQYAQNYDTLIFCEEHHTPLEFKYSFSDRIFTSTNMAFNFYADIELDDDYDYVIVTSGSEGLPTGQFDGQYAIWSGRLWKWNATTTQWNDVDKDIDDKIDTNLFKRYEISTGVYNYNKCPSCVAFFNSRLFFASTIEDRQKIWASAAPDTTGQRYTDFSTFRKYVTVDKVVKDPDIHIFTANIKKADIDKTNNTTRLSNVSQDFLTDGKLKKAITEYYCYNSNYVPGATKVLRVGKAADNTYYIDLPVALDITWDTTTNITYDSSGAMHTETVEETVRLAVTFNLSLWVNPTSASADDYEYKVIHQNLTTSDCSFNFEIASDQNDAIRWIGANKYMTVGTESSVWCIPSAVTALNIAAEMNGRYGSDMIQGHCVGNAMIFFAQGKHGIREYYYDNQSEAFNTNNIAILAEQMLTESPAKEFDFVTNPYNRIIITREDGNVVSLLYDKNNGVMAWNRITMDQGKIYSTAVTRGEKDTDIIYFIVKDNNKYYLEKLDPNEKVYLDSWKVYATGDENNYTDEAVLYNETKDTECMANNIPDNFYEATDKVYIGYKYESVISSMPVIANDTTGKKRITNLIIRFLESYMPEITIDDLAPELFYDVIEPYSGVKQITYPGISDRDVTFTIRTNKVKPTNILSVNASLA